MGRRRVILSVRSAARASRPVWRVCAADLRAFGARRAAPHWRTGAGSGMASAAFHVALALLLIRTLPGSPAAPAPSAPAIPAVILDEMSFPEFVPDEPLPDLDPLDPDPIPLPPPDLALAAPEPLRPVSVPPFPPPQKTFLEEPPVFLLFDPAPPAPPDFTPLLAAYWRQIRSAVLAHLRFPDVFRGGPRETNVTVRIAIGAGGDVMGLAALECSPDSVFAQAAIAAVRRAAPFPRPPSEIPTPARADLPVRFKR